MEVRDRERMFTRVIRAPRALVFEAWTELRRVAQWYGPQGYTAATHEMDGRPGGKWQFIMRGRDGTNHPNLIM